MHRLASPEPVADRAVLTHLMVDMYGVDATLLNNAQQLAEILTGAASAATLHPLADPVVYRYPSQGLTVFLPIRESHFAMHTYPEYEYASVDIVSCSTTEQAERAQDFIVESLKAVKVESRIVSRGFPHA